MPRRGIFAEDHPAQNDERLVMAQESILLDKEAQRLYRQFQGLDFREETSLGLALSEEEKKLNACRGLLGQLVHLLSVCFESPPSMRDPGGPENFLDEFLTILSGLAEIPGHDGKILIRFRGLRTGTQASEKIDYVILFGNIVFDMASAAMLQDLEGFSKDFQSRLTRNFEIFSQQGINNLFLKIPEQSPQVSKALAVTLQTLSLASQTLSTSTSNVAEKIRSGTSLPLIHDERDQPDLNLTLLARVNNIKPDTMKAFVQKVDAWIHRPDYRASEEQFSSIYNAILGIKTLRNKLVPPPIEVNNIKWLMVDTEYEAVSKPKTEVARVVTNSYGHTPQEMARVMVSVYGDDYQQIDSQNLGERLRLASNLLTSIEGTDAGQPVMDEVLENVEKRLDQASDAAYDSLEIHEDVIKARDGETETTIGRIHSKLKGMVGFFKARSAIKRKMKNLAERGISFDEHDYKVIAKDFDVSVDEAKKLIETFKSCFNEQGAFLRQAFARNVPVFARFRKKVLEFLWHYLKQMSQREDRIALLNSLQILIPRLNQPQRILRTLLTDFANDPASIAVSDRSALVLATLLVSNYNKELRKDIEITPEEVLSITRDIDTRLAMGASRLLDGNQEKFFKKVRTIHRKLTEFLDCGEPQDDPVTLRDLFLLERELFILLSIVGGNAARTLLKSAARVYGDPRAEIYFLDESERALPSLLQLLKIIGRGLGRAGDKKDSHLLDSIRLREKEFIETVGSKKHQEHVRRAMECVKISAQQLVARK
jgi:hypothetical protein